jgi:hypothetical protein
VWSSFCIGGAGGDGGGGGVVVCFAQSSQVIKLNLKFHIRFALI